MLVSLPCSAAVRARFPPEPRSNDDDALGINTDNAGIFLKKANRHADVLHGFHGVGAVLIEDAVFNGDGDTSTGGKMMAVGNELGGHGGIPQAAVKKENAVEVGLPRDCARGEDRSGRRELLGEIRSKHRSARL